MFWLPHPTTLFSAVEFCTSYSFRDFGHPLLLRVWVLAAATPFRVFSLRVWGCSTHLLLLGFWVSLPTDSFIWLFAVSTEDWRFTKPGTHVRPFWDFGFSLWGFGFSRPPFLGLVRFRVAVRLLI